jgi:hypothetical protein
MMSNSIIIKYELNDNNMIKIGRGAKAAYTMLLTINRNNGIVVI